MDITTAVLDMFILLALAAVIYIIWSMRKGL